MRTKVGFRFGWLLVLYGCSLLLLSVVHFWAPQRAGPLALSQVFAPHLFLPLVVLLPLALWRSTTVARVVLVVALAVGAIRFMPGMVGLPAGSAAGNEHLKVMTWNLAAGEGAAGVLVERLLTGDFDVVALQELRPEHETAIEADERLRSRFPSRLLEGETTTLGLGLLSRFPLIEPALSRDPPMIATRLQLDSGATVTIVTAHPPAPRIRAIGGLLPVGYETAERDDALRRVRDALDSRTEGRLVLLGDFNVTDREVGYSELADSLRDAHHDVGMGPGSTWRPAMVDFLPLGFLRIDYVFTAGDAHALSVAVECVPNAGDHCIVEGLIEVSPASR